MRIIALVGHGNCGKSHTLNCLKELLRTAGTSISSTPHPNCEQPETFLYQGLIVCVAPAGDGWGYVQENVRYFQLKQCDVAISATRCKGGSVEALDLFAKSVGVYVERVQKSYESNLSEATQDLCNYETAQFLFNLIGI